MSQIFSYLITVVTDRSELRENKRRGREVSMDIPQSQVSAVGMNWSTNVTQVGTEVTFPFTVVTELRTEG